METHNITVYTKHGKKNVTLSAKSRKEACLMVKNMYVNDPIFNDGCIYIPNYEGEN